MPDQSGIESGGSNVETREAIEETKAQEIRPEKAPKSAESSLSRMPAGALFKTGFKVKVGEVVDLGDVAGDRRIRVVKNVAIQGANPPTNHQPVVGIDSEIGRAHV